MISINENCNGCGICKVVCPYERIRIEGGVAGVDECEECGVCVKFCPFDAVEIRRDVRTFKVERKIVETKAKGGKGIEIKGVGRVRELELPNKMLLKLGVFESVKPYELLQVCSRCGACTFCEALELGDRPVLVGDCKECGFCTYICPKFNVEVCRDFIKEVDMDYGEFLERVIRRYSVIVWDSLVGDSESLKDVLERMKIDVDYESCVSCGVCAKVCPINAISFEDKPIFDSCFLCGLCVKVCRQKALKKPKVPSVLKLKEDFDRAVFVGFPCDVLAVKRLNDERIVCLVSLECKFCEFDKACPLKDGDCGDVRVGKRVVIKSERGERFWEEIRR